MPQRDPRTLLTRAPFSALFPVKPEALATITAAMRETGFDVATPIVVWGETVIDGHVRRQAALDAGLASVPVVMREFADELAALHYAIAAQVQRRNLNARELVAAAKHLDQVRTRGGDHGNQHTGGKVAKTSIEVFATPGASAAELAARLGVSRSTAERIRAIARDPIAVANVEAGESINQAYTKLRERKNAAREDNPLRRKINTMEPRPKRKSPTPSTLEGLPGWEDIRHYAETERLPTNPVLLAKRLAEKYDGEQMETLIRELQTYVASMAVAQASVASG